MARHDGRSWTIGLEGDAEFAAYVEESPLLDAEERRVFEGYVAGGGFTTTAVTGLQLPFPVGTSQVMTSGPHGWGGFDRPYSAAAFAGGNRDDRVARGGTARSICNGWARVIHDNGYSTDYYHLSNFQWLSGSVGANWYLGEHGTSVCAGGAASGPHVHFALRRYDANLNGWYVPLNGNSLGGWWFWEGAAYGGYAYNPSHGYAYPGNWMYNFGG
jgi:murein DD-endopeptidase MepM/ murein hydrolase activator NlpD